MGIADQAVELTLEERASGSYAINGDALAKEFGAGLVVAVGIELRPVLPIRDQQNHFAAITRIAVFQQLGGFEDGIVEGFSGLRIDTLKAGGVGSRAGGRLIVDGGSAEGSAGAGHGRLRFQIHALEFRDQAVLVFAEAFPFVEKLVEAADEGFVAGAEAANDGDETWFDLLLVLAFEIVVDQDDQGERHGLDGKAGDLLLDIVLEDAELIPTKIGNQTAVM